MGGSSEAIWTFIGDEVAEKSNLAMLYVDLKHLKSYSCWCSSRTLNPARSSVDGVRPTAGGLHAGRRLTRAQIQTVRWGDSRWDVADGMWPVFSQNKTDGQVKI